MQTYREIFKSALVYLSEKTYYIKTQYLQTGQLREIGSQRIRVHKWPFAFLKKKKTKNKKEKESNNYDASFFHLLKNWKKRI